MNKSWFFGPITRYFIINVDLSFGLKGRRLGASSTLDFFEMLVVQSIRDRDHPLVETMIACLVTCDEQNRLSQRIKRIEDSIRSPLMLDSEFAHMRVLGPDNS